MVMDFDTPAIEGFLYNWFRQEKLRPLAGELLAALDGSRRFKELARNPLLLLLIVDHYERERNLPNLRAELYRHCIRTRITRWNTVRGTHGGRFGETDKWRMLRELALYLYQQEQRGLIDAETLLTWLDDFVANLRLPEDTTPPDLLDEVARTSGLIQERAIGRYGFSHLTLQEYFAAEGVDRLGPDEGATLLGEHLADAPWQEVILLYCGLADNAGPLLRRILRQAGRGEQDDKDPWLLAGRCLAEGAWNVPPQVCRQVAEGLVALLRRAEADESVSLTPDEGSEIVAQLETFAASELPGYVRTLLDSHAPHDALLAARLLPETAASDLRAEVTRRMATLARSEETTARRVATAALGWIAEADGETITALRTGLADADPTARAEAARALGRLGAPDETSVAKLLDLYAGDPADAPRHAALESLLVLGRAADLGMVLVPAGEFLLGSPDNDPDARDNEKPQHVIYLPAFYLDRTPVTNAQFRRFIEAGGYADEAYWAEAIEAGRWKEGAYLDYYSDKFRAQPEYWDDPEWNGDEQPVVGVTWYEALAYALWAGKRLPSEAEWEKAAAWVGEMNNEGHQRRYPWGNEWAGERANTKEAGLKKTTVVGCYSPAGDSPYGAVDMAGNVWEWCSTRYNDYPYDPNDGREDLGGGDDVFRVLRGGSWYNDRKGARCAPRSRSDPWNRYATRGFRCCCATSSPSPGSES
jgi:formylglycine-generating enzyme required for sulfatase activity